MQTFLAIIELALKYKVYLLILPLIGVTGISSFQCTREKTEKQNATDALNSLSTAVNIRHNKTVKSKPVLRHCNCQKFIDQHKKDDH